VKKAIALVFALILIFTFLFSLSAAAKTSVEHDYILEDSKPIPIPVTHKCAQVYEYIEGYEPSGGELGLLNNPQDIEADDEGCIYIADTGNNAVLKISADGKLLLNITEAGEKSISYPLGLFVDKNHDIFFSDNGNRRIVHLDAQGNFVEEFTAPESELLSQNLTTFDPSKIGIIDYTGYIYLLIGKEFLTLDAHGSFKGLVGTEPVGFNLSEWLTRQFATEKQKQKIRKREPMSYNNFCVTRDNKIYAVSMASSGQIKKINVSGDNTFPDGVYGQRSPGENGKMLDPVFVDISVNSYGIITVADQLTSRLYQYNDNGELLAVFGGKGSGQGKFSSISAICYDANDRLLVLDAAAGCVQVLEPTAFLKNIHNSVQLYLDGKYDESLTQWETMLRQISTYPTAQNSVADIYFRSGDYQSAINQYKESGNRDGAGTVFAKVRAEFVSSHFLPVVLCSILILTAFIWVLLYMRRYCVWVEEDLYTRSISRKKEFAGLSRLAFFHPIRAWDLLKWRRISGGGERVNLFPVIVLPLLAVASRWIFSRFTSFQVSVIDQQNVSLLWEFLLMIVPYMTLGMCVFKITGVMGGEISLYETFSALGYSLLPVITVLPVLTALSHIVASGEAGLFRAAVNLVYIWMTVMAVSAVYRINDISVKRTVGLCVICLLGMLIAWVMCALIYIFSAQIRYFFSDLLSEIFWRFRGI